MTELKDCCASDTLLFIQKSFHKQCRCHFDPKTVLMVGRSCLRSGRVLIVAVWREPAHGHIPNEDFQETERTEPL